MKTLEIKQATGDLASYAPQVRSEPVVITENGKPVMALMPLDNADLETVSLSTDPRFIALIERSRTLYRPGTGIPLEGIRRKYGRSGKPRRNAARKTARSSSRP
jgi:antitoxin (DNA-binding transcriptional repressor) of toxin-antitoxin stability system